MPPKERVKFLAQNDKSGAIVKELPPNDAWLTIKTVGVHDAIPVIKHLSAEQLQHVTDIEFWQKDELNELNAIEWLKILGECGEKKLIEFIDKCDPLALGTIIKKLIHIEKKDNTEDNPLERAWPFEMPPVTLDGVYFFQAASKEAEENLVPLLKLIAEHDYERYASMCEEIIFESTATLQEEAYTWRQKRMADEGFVPFDEAIHIYATLSDKQMSELPKRSGKNFKPDHVQTLRAISIFGDKEPFLKQAASKIDDQELLEELRLEIFSIANRVIIADAHEITPEEIERALRKTLEFIDLGLRYISGSDPEKGTENLKTHLAKGFFQAGFTLEKKAKKKL